MPWNRDTIDLDAEIVVIRLIGGHFAWRVKLNEDVIEQACQSDRVQFFLHNSRIEITKLNWFFLPAVILSNTKILPSRKV